MPALPKVILLRCCTPDSDSHLDDGHLYGIGFKAAAAPTCLEILHCHLGWTIKLVLLERTNFRAVYSMSILYRDLLHCTSESTSGYYLQAQSSLTD